jgi:prevent-host-death family protein
MAASSSSTSRKPPSCTGSKPIKKPSGSLASLFPTDVAIARPSIARHCKPDQTTLVVMILKNISEAKAELSSLIESVSKGEEVLIGKAGVPVARLVATAERVPGRLAGKITIADDFDTLPDDVADAFGMR